MHYDMNNTYNYQEYQKIILRSMQRMLQMPHSATQALHHLKWSSNDLPGFQIFDGRKAEYNDPSGYEVCLDIEKAHIMQMDHLSLRMDISPSFSSSILIQTEVYEKYSSIAFERKYSSRTSSRSNSLKIEVDHSFVLIYRAKFPHRFYSIQ